MKERIFIRSVSDNQDWDKVRELCCLTGNNGKPIALHRWAFFSEYWIGPYQKLLQDWTYVATNDQKIVGYLTGCPNSSSFERKKRISFFPQLYWNALKGKYKQSGDLKNFIRRSIGIEASPEGVFSRSFKKDLFQSYPAHLHVNLDSSSRGIGAGRLLVERFFSDLRSVSVHGAHVFCGEDPVPFYKKLGFTALNKASFFPTRTSEGVSVYAMGRKL